MVTESGAIKSLCPECAGAEVEDGRDDDSSFAPASRAASGYGARRRTPWLRYAVAGGLALAFAFTARLATHETAPAAASLRPAVLAQISAKTRPSSTAAPLHSRIHSPAAASPSELSGNLSRSGQRDGSEFAGDEEFGDSELADDENVEPTLDDLLEESGGTLEEMFPTLMYWEFPVQGLIETFPLRPSRRFGAKRDGIRRPECRAGHCGVDLGGKTGTAILAVAWGRVSRIQRDEDRTSGKYVRIEHPDFVYTYYMHLDSIAEGLRVGQEVEPGQRIGTLGSTGILFSAPHLHFSLEILKSGRLTYVDPAPYLQRAIAAKYAD